VPEVDLREEENGLIRRLIETSPNSDEGAALRSSAQAQIPAPQLHISKLWLYNGAVNSAKVAGLITT
jgi:hypothetical protein